MKQLLFILLLTIPFFGFGQGWEKTYGGTGQDEGRSVQQTNDGGYIICGKTTSFGSGVQKIYLIKTDSNGDSLWTRIIGTVQEEGVFVQQTNDGGYIVCGKTYSFSTWDNILVIKLDGGGNQQWSQTFGGNVSDMGQSIQQTNDGGYIITGTSNSDVILIKIDGGGNQQWSQTFQETSNSSEFGNSVQQTNDGGYIVCGYTMNIGNNDRDVYLIKTNGSGSQQWSQTFGGNNWDHGYSVQQTNDGGYIICGQTESFGNGQGDMYLIKTDGSGNQQWSQTFGGSNLDYGLSIKQTNDGGYIICGETNSFTSGSGDIDLYLIKTDGNGNQQWTQMYDDSYEDRGYSVQQTNDGGYIICGYTYSNGYDIYLIKTDSQGNITSTFNITTKSSNRKLEKIVDILGRETKPQTNSPFIEIYDDGGSVKKLIIEK